MTDLLFCITLLALLSRYRVCGPARFEKSLDLCVQDKRIRHDSFQNTAFSVKTLLFTKGDIYVVTVFHPQFPRTPLRTHAPQFVAHEKMAFTFRHRLPTYMDVNRPCNVILADWKPHSSNLAAYLSINKELRCLQNQFVLYFKLFSLSSNIYIGYYIQLADSPHVQFCCFQIKKNEDRQDKSLPEILVILWCSYSKSLNLSPVHLRNYRNILPKRKIKFLSFYLPLD